MNAIELLEKQHEETLSLFRKAGKAEGSSKRQLFERLADGLAVHATIEEKHFYPALRTDQTEAILRESLEEHLGAKRLIADLLALQPDNPEFEAKLTVLREQIEHHIEEERSEVFPAARKLLSRDELEDLAVVMEDLADELEEGTPRDSVPAETAEAAPLE